MATVMKVIPARNLQLLLNDLDGMKVTVSRGFASDEVRVYFKRRHMKHLVYLGRSRYYS